MSFYGDPLVIVTLAILAVILPPIDVLINWRWNKAHGITEVD